MLTQLKIVEQNLFQEQKLIYFWKKHGIHAIIKQLNKTTKKQTKQRIKFLLFKVSNNSLYPQFLSGSLTQNQDEQKQFTKYVSSQNSEQYYNLLLQKQFDVIKLFDQNPLIIPVTIKLIKYEHGIKIVKLFTRLYQRYAGQYQCLFQQTIRKQIELGIQLQDSVVQIRFVELIANISVNGGKCYKFVSDLLKMSLHLYETEDILLKLSLVQIISNLGTDAQTSQILKNHQIWKLIEKDASDNNQQFYIRKHLLILLIEMSIHGQFQITPKFTKNIIQFLLEHIESQGQYLCAAIQTISHLFKTAKGCSIVIQNSQVFNKYIEASRKSQNDVKIIYLTSLTMLTQSTQQTAIATQKIEKYHMVLNVLNCVGLPTLAMQISHNVQAKNHSNQGISNFCKWFANYLLLPFQDIEENILNIFTNLLNYTQIMTPLVQNQEVSKYLLKRLNSNNSDKVIRIKKNDLINKIIYRGRNQWKGLELQEYTRMLEQYFKADKMQMQVAFDVQ